MSIGMSMRKRRDINYVFVKRKRCLGWRWNVCFIDHNVLIAIAKRKVKTIAVCIVATFDTIYLREISCFL